MENKEIQLTDEQFWNGASVFINNLPSVHKKLSAVIDLRSYQILNTTQKLDKNSVIEKVLDFNNIPQILNEFNISFDVCERIKDLQSCMASYQGLISVKKFILKLKASTFMCLQILDFNNNSIIQYCPLDDFKEMLSYEIKLINGNLKVSPFFQNDKAENWCINVLKPKFLKWTNLRITNVKTSNKLVDLEQYAQLYSDLKEKYGEQLVKSWKESTDPKKFVYEDIGIATYLIMLWKETKQDFKGFLDLGCGNGLLVYILNSEGYFGYGIDGRKRKIWDTYPASVILLEKMIDPSTFNLENDEKINWIIGNHSDELSAWIPILSSLNSYETNYFLLPCCAYELTGEKFQRRNSKLSVYNDFLHYIEEISQLCGFLTISDRLKIPSTKRFAYIGLGRTFEKDEFEIKSSKLKENISKQIAMKNMKLREKKEIVRNCTQLDKTFIDEIVLKIFKIILNENECENNENWIMGQNILISDLVKCLHKKDLETLKSECGGIKTLLKNKHEIFQLHGDKVGIRKPQVKNDFSKEMMTYKKRKCFFFYYHPNRCPLSCEECTFLHDEDM